MKYFIVHNNYHILDIQNHIDKTEEAMLIVIPHFIDNNLLSSSKYRFINIKSPFLNKTFLFPNIIIRKKKEIGRLLPDIDVNDTLFVYAEEEWLVHHIIKKFHKHKCRIILLEDGGLPNYLKFSAINDHTQNLKTTIKFILIKVFWFYWYSNSISIGGITYPRIQDELFSSFNCYFDVEINRNIPVKVIKKKTKKINNLDPNTCIFLNEYIYKIFCAWNIYINELKSIITVLDENFEKIYFKFHPRELENERNKIKLELGSVKKLIFIDDNSPIETLYTDYNPGYLISYHSAALMDAYFKGIVPVYIFHFCKSIKDHPISISIKKVLESINFIFPKNIKDLKPGFDCGKLKSR